MIIYNKLVRDKIPQIIKINGKKVNTRILSNEEYEKELRRKLIEEAKELFEASSREEIIEELADLYEIIETILITKNINIYDIQKKRIKKNMTRGAFEDKILLESVD